MKYSNNFSRPSGIRRSLVTWLTIITFFFQTIAPSYAAVMSDAVIENDLASNPAFQPDASGLFNYIASAYIDAQAPAGAQNMAGFYKQVKKDYRFAVDASIAPISVGDITIFVDAFKRYKSVGDDLVQSRYVRAQIRSILGRSLINADASAYRNEAAQINTLYKNTLNYINSSPAAQFGKPLNKDQDNSGFGKDIIWPELRTIHGEQVLVPIVYLTKVTVDAHKVRDNSTEFNGATQFSDLIIEGSTIQLGREAFLSVVNSLLINGGELLGSGNLTIRVGGEIRNLSGLIQAQGDLVIGAKSIHSETIVHRYDFGAGNTGGYFGEIASIKADGSVILRAHEGIILAGAHVSAGQDIRFAANGNIYIGSVQLATSYDGRVAGWRTSQGSAIEYLGSKLSAEESIELIANGNILIDASEIVAGNDHIEILAGLGITIEDELNVSQSYKKGKFGKTKKEVSAYKTVAMRSLLDAGKDIRLHTEFGDITLKAVDITSADGAAVTAANGKVNLLVTKETDHYSYSSIKKSLFTIKTVNRGHDIETVVPNTIVGGFKANALNGLNVEYEGDAAYSLDEQVAELSKFEGLEWMADVRANHPDADWTAIEAKYEEWNEKNTSLSPAFAAVIAIVVAVATQGAAASVAGALVETAGFAATATTATGVVVASTATTVVAAGVSSLFVQASLAVANGAANGDVGGALEDLASSDTIKSIVIAMVTAGAMQALDAEFFNVTAPPTDSAGNVNSVLFEAAKGSSAPYQLTFTGQAFQAVTHATARSAINAITNGDSLGEFVDGLDEVLVQSLAQNAVNQLGRELAEEIGIASKPKRDSNTGEIIAPPDINQITRYIAHAATGCLTGSLTAGINQDDVESGCASGAGGAVVGEAIGDLYVYAHKDEVDLLEDVLKDELEYLETFGADGTDGKTILAALEGDHAYYYTRLDRLHEQGVGIARVSASLSAFLAGADVANIYIAADAGENAAANNALPALFWGATALLSAAGAYLTAVELKSLGEQIIAAEQAGDTTKRDALLKELAGSLALEAGLVLVGGKAVDALADIIKKARQNGVGDKIIGKLDELVTNDTARSVANGARLRAQLAGREIAGGHAFEKHVLQQGEFAGLGIRTREQFARHIENVISNPTASRMLGGGRTAYWDDASSTVVIRNPRAADGGTAFQPVQGRAYFDDILN